MEPKVFRYRRAATVTIPGFLSFWSVVWLFGLLRMGPHGPVKIDGRPATPAEAALFFWFGLFVGIVIGSVAARLMLGWWNERVEVRDGTIAWFDWRGRVRVRAELTGGRAVQPLSGMPFMRQGYSFWLPQGWPWALPVERFLIKTDRGEIQVSGTISGFEELRAIAQEAWRRNVAE